jgi:glycosyltransferase involved in cell wall biosynthesis
MKILLMTSLWGPHGGKESYFLYCANEFVRMGHECSVAYGRISSLSGEVSVPSIHEYEIASYSDIRSTDEARGAEQLQGVLQDESPDIIFMCDVRNLRLLEILKNYGGLVTISHDNWLTCMRGTTTTYFRRHICTHTFGYRCLLHGCFLRKDPVSGRVVYNSIFEHQAVLDAYKEINIHLVTSRYMKARLVQHGVNQEYIRVVGTFADLQPSGAVPVAAGLPSITFMGRVDRYKGVDYLLRALAQLSIPFRCSIIGDGEYLPYCKELSQNLGIAESIDFTGRISRDILIERLTDSSIVVVPSLWPESFGVVGLEAMMCSKPVVAFDTGGISDWLKDGINGYLVPVKSVKLLAQRIETLLRDQDKAAEMGAEGYRIATTCFTRERHFEYLFSAFELAAVTRRKGLACKSLLPIL